MLVAAKEQGRAVTLRPKRTLPGPTPVLVDGPPSVAEEAFYQKWADVEQQAVAVNEAKLLAELREGRDDALSRAENRARTIAYHGFGWLAGEVNRVYQTEAGVPGYGWMTMGDDFVRAAHVELDGSYQRWDDPPVAEANGQRYHAGLKNRCRCYGVPAWKAD
jgi:SPP1 gp7 family putative phage head morphogenesis protein